MKKKKARTKKELMEEKGKRKKKLWKKLQSKADI